MSHASLHLLLRRLLPLPLSFPVTPSCWISAPVDSALIPESPRGFLFDDIIGKPFSHCPWGCHLDALSPQWAYLGRTLGPEMHLCHVERNEVMGTSAAPVGGELTCRFSLALGAGDPSRRGTLGNAAGWRPLNLSSGGSWKTARALA